MTVVVVLGVALWLLGRRMGVAKRDRWMLIGLLYVAVLALLVALPEGHPVQLFLGGTLGEWLVVGLLVVVVYLYSQGLGWLRGKVAERNTPAESGPFDAAELERYARHITLREIGGTGQKRLKDARVLIIGAGGLGSPAGMYLAAAGVGTIGIIDDDKVELPNLQRQIAHTDARSGHMKVFSAEKAMLAINPRIKLRPYNRRFDARIAEDLLDDYDMLLDGSDNFETRYLANRVASKAGKPLIAAALSQWEGQISLYDTAQGTPCYACVFPTPPEPDLAPSCAEAGVLGPLTGVIGAMMATEAVKHIAGAGDTLAGRMLIYDALYAETRVISLARRQDCPVCGTPLGETAGAH